MAAYTYYLGGSAASDKHPYFQLSSITAPTNGGPLYSNVTAGCCSIEDNGSSVARLHLDSGTWGVAIPDGSYLRLEFASADHYSDGFYKVTTGAAAGAHTLLLDLTFVDTEDVNAVYVGGARLASRANLNAVYLSTTVEYFDAAKANGTLTWASTNKITVKIYSATAIDCAGTAWTVGSRVGSATYWVDCIACDSSWVASAESVQTTNASTGSITTGLLTTATVALQYLSFYGFDFNANYPEAVHADYGFSSSTNHSDYINFHKCIFRNSHKSGYYGSSNGPLNWLYKCKAFLNEEYGFTSNITTAHSFNLYGSSSYSNKLSGVRTSGIIRIDGCYVYNNGNHGIELLNVSAGSVINNNVICKNGADSSFASANNYDGINFITGCTNAIVRNNIIALNGRYSIYDADSGLAVNSVSSNLSVIDGGMTGHANFMASVASDSEWAAETFYNNFIKSGNIAAADPKFVDWTTMVGATNEANWNLALQSDAPSLNQIPPFYSNISAANHRIDYPAVAEVIDSAKMADLPVDGAGHMHGTYHAPAAAEVISTAVFGPASGTAGTVVQPAVADVKDGVFYGPGSALEGEYAGGGGGSVIIVDD